MKFKIKEWCLAIATLGPVGYQRLNEFIAALIAIPLSVAFGWLCSVSGSAIFYGTMAPLVFIAMVSVTLALRFETDQPSDVLVMGTFLGMLVAFAYVPMSVKFAFIGYILFFVMKYIIPYVFRRIFGDKVDQWPLEMPLLGFNILAGVVVNIFLQFVWWMAN